jgi:hypothetical protein
MMRLPGMAVGSWIATPVVMAGGGGTMAWAFSVKRVEVGMSASKNG